MVGEYKCLFQFFKINIQYLLYDEQLTSNEWIHYYVKAYTEKFLGMTYEAFTCLIQEHDRNFQ